MEYRISRQGQQYGPYSLADLQRYVRQGAISEDDLAHSEAMEEWLPVSQVLGNITVHEPGAPQSYGRVPVESAPAAAGLPNGLHWAVLLLLDLITFGVFNMVWMFVQASYAKRLRPHSHAILFYAIGLGGIVLSPVVQAAFGVAGFEKIAGFLAVGSVVLLYAGHWSVKGALEDYYNTEEPIHLRLSGVMTLFFSNIYFQYHFSRIRDWKLTGVLR